MSSVTINLEQGLYVIPCGRGYTCLGFEVAERKRRAVLEWIGEPVQPCEPGTIGAYDSYLAAMARGAEHARQTGTRCPAELEPRLTGLEGRRVEVSAPGGPARRFYVGKSTGWMPCHLEIARRDSMGGPAVYLPEGASVRVVGTARR